MLLNHIEWQRAGLTRVIATEVFNKAAARVKICDILVLEYYVQEVLLMITKLTKQLFNIFFLFLEGLELITNVVAELGLLCCLLLFVARLRARVYVRQHFWKLEVIILLLICILKFGVLHGFLVELRTLTQNFA